MAELPTQRDFEDFGAWSGRDVLGPGGERIGAVDTIFLDEATGVPEWVLVSRDDGAALVPLAGATVEERAIRVEQPADRVAAAPRPEVGETLSVADKKRLYEHYGLEYSQAESETVLPEGATAAEAPPEPAEEQPEPEPASAPASTSAAADMAPRNLSSATPSELPPQQPQTTPPQGGGFVPPPQSGFTQEVQESRGLPFGKGLPAALGGAIAALILILIFRRRR